MGEGDLSTGTWLSKPVASSEVLHVRSCRLDVLAGPDAGRSEVFASATIVVGRSGADLALTDRKVSGLHAELRIEPGGYRLRDLGSTNGTFVLGVRVVEAIIAPGTTISVGDTLLRLEPLATSSTIPLWEESRLCGLIGQSSLMRGLFSTIDRVAATEATVLINGETGSGKELVAEAIHQRSPRAHGPFVVLDCSAVPMTLFEDQLFGHEAGSFTGASRTTAGLFESAHGGTLFLDELGELPLEVQPKLLRAVETRRISRIGGSAPIACDVRLVAATNRNLAREINRGSFRSDLYYRLAVARLTVPPLRQRLEDLELLIEHFLDGMPGAPTLPDGFLPWARNHPWPGNVRELRNAVERALALPDGAPMEPAAAGVAAMEIDLAVPFKQAKQRLVDAFDRRYVTALLEAHQWNLSAAARAAGVDRMSIYKMLQRLGIRERGEP